MVSKISRITCLFLDADQLTVRITDVSEKPPQGSRYSNWARVCMVRSSNPREAKRFIFSPKVQTGPGIHPNLLFNWYTFPGGKAAGTRTRSWRPWWQGRKVNHSPPSSANVRNEWSYNSTPPIRHQSDDRKSFTFTEASEK